jgi:hypothetical protein
MDPRGGGGGGGGGGKSKRAGPYLARSPAQLIRRARACSRELMRALMEACFILNAGAPGGVVRDYRAGLTGPEINVKKVHLEPDIKSRFKSAELDDEVAEICGARLALRVQPSSACNGLDVIYYVPGHGQDYMTISLRDGGAAIGMTLANGRLDLHIKPTRIRFDDNQWHKIMVHRKVQEVSC